MVSSTTTTLECVLDEIKAINPTAPVHSTTYSKVPDLGWVLDAKCFDAERVKDVDATFARVSGDDDEDGRRGGAILVRVQMKTVTMMVMIIATLILTAIIIIIIRHVDIINTVTPVRSVPRPLFKRDQLICIAFIPG